ncbi:MAG: radical SAM protein [Neisseriaceae bacterium]|nr:radical SAM protein [Neisseriaceae bacterium]
MFPIDYIEPVFRPPSEARSLILPVTNGCSWNKCTFCEMYTAPQKKFHTRNIETIREELSRVAALNIPIRRIFLADGDAMTLSFRRLHEIMTIINHYFPHIERVSSYCLPRNIANKSIEELQELREMGLKLVYVGCESGDDLVLQKIHKSETYLTSEKALLKLGEAGIKRSVMILNGLGGMAYSHQHAINSARLMNGTQPEYLSVLVLNFPNGKQRLQQDFPEFVMPDTMALLDEMSVFIESLNLNKTIFRSDHASNYVVLKGILNQDQDRLLAQIENAKRHPETLRPEWARGL